MEPLTRVRPRRAPAAPHPPAARAGCGLGCGPPGPPLTAGAFVPLRHGVDRAQDVEEIVRPTLHGEEAVGLDPGRGRGARVANDDPGMVPRTSRAADCAGLSAVLPLGLVPLHYFRHGSRNAPAKTAPGAAAARAGSEQRRKARQQQRESTVPGGVPVAKAPVPRPGPPHPLLPGQASRRLGHQRELPGRGSPQCSVDHRKRIRHPANREGLRRTIGHPRVVLQFPDQESGRGLRAEAGGRVMEPVPIPRRSRTSGAKEHRLSGRPRLPDRLGRREAHIDGRDDRRQAQQQRQLRHRVGVSDLPEPHHSPVGVAGAAVRLEAVPHCHDQHAEPRFSGGEQPLERAHRHGGVTGEKGVDQPRRARTGNAYVSHARKPDPFPTTREWLDGTTSSWAERGAGGSRAEARRERRQRPRGRLPGKRRPTPAPRTIPRGRREPMPSRVSAPARVRSRAGAPDDLESEAGARNGKRRPTPHCRSTTYAGTATDAVTSGVTSEPVRQNASPLNSLAPLAGVTALPHGIGGRTVVS